MRARTSPLVAVACASLVASLALVAPALPSQAAARAGPGLSDALRTVQANPAVPRGAARVGALAGATPLQMRLVLAPRDPASLASFISSASTPGSPRYGRYLSAGAFAARFGPTASSIATVRAAVVRAGLRVTHLSSSHLVMSVEGSAASFDEALHSTASVWRLADGARGYRFDRAARLPGPVARLVAGIVGTSSLVREHAAAVRGARVAGRLAPSLAPQTCAAAQQAISDSSPGTFSPTEEGRAYGIDTSWQLGDDGTARTVALLEFAPYALSDVLAYDHCFSLIAPSATTDSRLRNILVDGGTSPGSGSQSAEPTLDIDQIRALAPGASLGVYLGPNNVNGPIDTLQRIATDDTAQVVSISWGLCEAFSEHAAETPIFEQMAAQGQTVFAASGDSGSSDCLQQSLPGGPVLTHPAVDDPASQPLVTGVGGLTVTRLSPLHESVWNDCASFATPGCLGSAGGGGISSVFARPDWQRAPGAPSGSQPGTHARLVPDLSVMADPSTGMLAYLDGSFQAYGGTSMGAPLMAALDAVAAQRCATPTFGFLNPLLYAMGRHGGDFVDVTLGSNEIATSTVIADAYAAGPGYDMASGLGSPAPSTFIAAMCNGVSTATATPSTPSAHATWTVSYRTGSDAYPVGTHVVLTAPPGTTLPSPPTAWSVATASGTHAPSAVLVASSRLSSSANVATLTIAGGAPPVGLITLTATGVVNPPTVGTASVAVTDSVDSLVASAPLRLDVAAPGALHSTVAAVPSSAGVATGGATIRVTVRDTAGDAIAGIRITAAATGHGVARFTARFTDSSGRLAFVLRDDRVESSRVRVTAGAVLVGSATVRFADPWRSRATPLALGGARVSGPPAVVDASGTRFVAMARLSDGRLLVAIPDGIRLRTVVLAVSASIPLCASPPSLARSGGWLYATYRSVGGHLIVLREGGGTHLGGWRGEDLTTARIAPLVSGDPSAAVSGEGTASRLSVAAVSQRRDVVRASAPLSDLSRFTILDVTRAAGQLPTAAGDVAQVALNGTVVLAVHTSDGRLVVFSPITGEWVADDLAVDASFSDAGGGAITGSPSAAVSAGVVTIAVETVSKHLDVFAGTPGNWSATTMDTSGAGTSRPSDMTSMPALDGTPRVAVSGATSVVLVPTVTGRLIELTSVGVSKPWSAYDLTALARTRGGGTAGVSLLPGTTLSLLGAFGGTLTQLDGPAR